MPAELKGMFGIGDVWTWTALCADSKLIVCWYVGNRQYEDAAAFMTLRTTGYESSPLYSVK